MNKKTVGSEFLNEQWHATARAPRPFPGFHSYNIGLEILGAETLREFLGAPDAVAVATSAGNRAASVGNRLARRTAGGRRLAALGKKLVQKAKSAQAAQSKSKSAASRAPSKASTNARAVAPARAQAAPARAAAPSRAAMAPARMQAAPARAPKGGARLGDSFSLQQAGMPSSDGKAVYDLQLLAQQAAETNALAQAGEIEDTVLTLVDQLDAAGNATLAQPGLAIAQRCEDAINNYPQDGGDPSVVGTVQQIASDAQAWQAQAKTAVTAGPAMAAMDSGGGGGGDSGYSQDSDASNDSGTDDAGDGGGSDESELPYGSEAVARFRESGGDWDPFEAGAPEDQEQYPPDDGGKYDDSGYADENAESDAEAGDESVAGFELFNPSTWFSSSPTPSETSNESAKAKAAASKSRGTEYDAASSDPRVVSAQRKLAATRAALSAARAGRTATTTAYASAPASGEHWASMSDYLSGDDMEWHDDDDILTDGYDHEVTDMDPDFERRRASVHRGASYGVPDGQYPPWGASSGQEGGEYMAKGETVTVFGHSAYQRGCDVLGAGLPHQVKPKTPPRAGFVAKTTPRGRKYTALVVNHSKGGKPVDHKKSIANAKDVAKRAIAVGQKLKKALAAKPAPAAAKSATKVHGAAPRRVVPHAPAHGPVSRGQLGKLAGKLVGHGKGLSQRANEHEAFTKAGQQKRQAGVAAVKQKTSPSTTRIHGGCEADEVYGLYEEVTEVLGEVLGVYIDPISLEGCDDDEGGYSSSDKLRQHLAGVATPDPNDPGYLTDGTVDPNYTGQGGAADDSPNTDVPTDGSDYGLGPVPTLADARNALLQFAVKDPYPDGKDQTFYHGLPDPSVVVYSGTPPMDHGDIGSYVAFYGPLNGAASEWGQGVGKDIGDDTPWTGGFRLHNDGWWYNWGKGEGQGGDNQHGTQGADKKAMGAGPHNWGPLVGNPNSNSPRGGSGTTFKNLRYDLNGDQFFWFYDKAPATVTADLDNQQLSKMLLEYKTQYTAAMTDAANQAAQEALDAQNADNLARQQAADDAQHQADMDKQAKAQELADAQAAQQQSAFDQQQSQAQAKLDQDMAAQQAALDVQMQKMQMQEEAQMAQAEAAYAQAHPEEYFSPAANAPQDDGQYQDDGYPEASPEDAQAMLEDDSMPDTDELAGLYIAGYHNDDVLYGHNPGQARASDKIRSRRSERRGE